jgi:hypothetical protein
MAYKFNPTTGKLDYYNSGSGTGDVVGPSGATDKAIARYDSTTGKLIQDSKAYVQDGGGVQAQAFIGKKEITDAVDIPSKHYMIASGITITNTGSITISSDSELILI